MPVAGTREDTWLVTVSIEGRDLGVFDTKDGAEGDSEEQKYPPGGMAAEYSLGGRQTLENLTVGRNLQRDRDWPLIKWLYSCRGWARGTIGITPLDGAGVRGGDPLVLSGTLKAVNPPDIDSTGGDAAMIELEFTLDGIA